MKYDSFSQNPNAIHFTSITMRFMISIYKNSLNSIWNKHLTSKIRGVI